MKINQVNSAVNAILGILLPQHCCLCQLACAGKLPICAGCLGDLARNTKPCRRCALPLHSAGDGNICPQCQRQDPVFDRVVAPWIYDELLAHLVHRWKFQRQRNLEPLIGHLCQLDSLAVSDVDVLVPMPLHWRRTLQRGFNQATVLALAMRGHCQSKTTVEPKLLRRTRATQHQSGLDAKQRQANLRGAFRAAKRCDNLRIALIDDVMTTGVTAAAAAASLKAAGAAYVEIWCLARTPILRQ